MTVILAIETSSPKPGVVLCRDGAVLFASPAQAEGEAQAIASLVAAGLAFAGLRAGEIDVLGVNIGPGGLGVVRAGVAFANALAFALDKPLYPFTYFEIAGVQAQKAAPWPVLSVLPAAGGDAYAALFDAGVVKIARFGELPVILPVVAAGLERITVAGRIRHKVAAHLPGVEVIDSGIDAPDPAIIIDLIRAKADQPPPPYAPASPLNEQARLFHD